VGLENPLHILIIALVILLVFGAKRLPELGRSLGTGMREFKSSITGEDTDATPDTPTPPHHLPQATTAGVETPATTPTTTTEPSPPRRAA
jgi:sec-independent protein translocase protein TatA